MDDDLNPDLDITPASDPAITEPPSSAGEAAFHPTDPAPAPAPGSAVEPPTIRGLVSSLGYQLEGIDDDYNAVVHLVQQAARARQLEEQARQADVYTQLGRQLAPQADRLKQALQQPAAPERKAYQPPPFNPEWRRVLDTDEQTGRYVARHPNVPQAIVDSANEYREWMGRFMENPVSVFEQFAADREQGFDARVQQAVQQGIQQYQTQQTVYQIAQQNAPWFYARDEQGGFLPDPVHGGYKVSPVGRQYLELAQWAAQSGVQDPVRRDQLARMALRNEIAQAAGPASPNAQVAAGRQERAMPASRPRTNPLQALTRQERQQTPGATEPDRSTISLADLFRQRFSEEGITDQHFIPESFGT